MSAQLPPGAELGEIVGGAEDGQRVAFIDSRNVALSLVVGFDNHVAITGTVPKAEIPGMLRYVADLYEARLQDGAS